MRRIDQIVVHCSATKEGQDFTAKDIHQWHKRLGWDGIGYHYVIRLDGTLEKGRPEEQLGAHAKGYNQHSIGLVYIGGLDQEGHPKDTRSCEQKATLLELLKDLKIRYPSAQILGHNNLPGVKKSCPCFDAKQEYANL